VANNIDKQVGSQVRARRQALGMSQSKLAEAVGLTFQQIQKYEKGANRVSASRLQQFSNILGVQVPFFFQDSPSSSSQRKMKSADPAITHVSEFISSADGQDLMKAYMKIRDAKLKRAIATFVEELAAR
jgi:transcriptional regulator with XRE-family HTH domain